MGVSHRMCYCLELETGVNIWAWFGTIINGICVIVYMIMALSYDERNPSISPSILDPFYHANMLDRQTGYCLFTIVFSIGFFTHYLVVIAVRDRNRKFLLPWMISNMFTLLLWTGLLFPVVYPVFIILSPIVILYYIWYCMYSLYQVLSFEEQNRFQAPADGPIEVL